MLAIRQTTRYLLSRKLSSAQSRENADEMECSYSTQRECTQLNVTVSSMVAKKTINTWVTSYAAAFDSVITLVAKLAHHTERKQ